MTETPKVDAYMRLYIGDWLEATADLTLEEEGAYMRLVMHLWKRGGVLPLDHTRLARMLRIPEADWRRIWDAIARMFIVDESKTISHRRVNKELEHAKARRDSAQRSANVRWAGGTKDASQDANAMQLSSIANQGQGQGQGQDQGQIRIPGPPARRVKNQAAPSREEPGVFDRALEGFRRLWQEQFGALYAITPQDKAQLGRLLSSAKKNGIDPELLPDLFRRYLADSDAFLAKQGHSLSWFCSSGAVNKYRANGPRSTMSPRTQQTISAVRDFIESHRAKGEEVAAK